MLNSKNPTEGIGVLYLFDLFEEMATLFLVDKLHRCYDNSQIQANSQDKEHPVDALQQSYYLLLLSNILFLQLP